MNKLTLNTGSAAIELIDRNALRTVVSATQTINLNATDKCVIKVRSAEVFEIPIGATCTIFGRFYRMNYLPRVEKLENRLFETDIELEGVQYDLIRVIYDLTIDTTNNQLQDVRGDALTGDLNRFATVLIANANRIFPGSWRLGECPTTAKDITLSFGETDNCLLVLQRLCQEFKTEFDITTEGDAFVLNFRKIGTILPFRFEFGHGKGVYKLERRNISQSNIITRLKVQGSSKNLTSKYRSARLCLPGKSKNLSFIEDPIKVEKYGLVETRKFFEDIYPSRTGRITGIKAGDVLHFSDDTMFDLNERDESGATKYLLPGIAARVHFNSGNLAGYEFDVVSYDHATHTFKIKALTDERGDTFPSETSTAFQFAVGDEYKLLQITLPQSYIDDAERRLKEEAEKLYSKKSQPEVTYGLTLEEMFIRKLYGQASGTILNVGDYVHVKDDDLMVDKSLRIAGFTRDLINEYKYNLTISESPASSNIISRIVEDLAEVDRILSINDLKNASRSRRNWRDTQELLDLVFDTDGYFLSEKIKPLSVETSMLSVGTKSAQLMLNGVVIEPNAGGNPNNVSVTSGTLDHLTLSDSIRTWSIHGGATVINDDEAHYIYARCAKDGNAGTIAFDKSKLKPEDEAGYYNFLIGVLHSVRNNVRGISLTYGSSTINGRFITTGVIQSNDGQSFLDLDKDAFHVGNNQSGLSWNINGDGRLRLKGSLITVGEEDTTIEDYVKKNKGVNITAVVRSQGTWRNGKMRGLQFYVNVKNADGSSVNYYQLRWRHLFTGESGWGNWTEWKSSSSYVYNFGDRDNSSARLDVEAEITCNGQTIVATCAVSNVKDGRDGRNGTDGQNGANGQPGRNGSDGRGIQSVVKEWAKTTDSENAPGQSSHLWSSIPPKPETGKYIWERTKTVMSDGTVSYSSPVRVELTGVSKALSEAFETSTQIQGGLVATTMLLVRNAANKIRAYFSGAGNKTNDIAFAAGVENFGLSNEEQASYIKQSGDAKFGELYIDAKGQAYAMRGGNRYLIIGGTIPTLPQLIAGEGDDVVGIGKNYSSFVVGGRTYYGDLTGSIRINNVGAEISIRGGVVVSHSLGTGFSSPQWVEIGLYRGSTLVETLFRISSRSGDAIHNNVDRKIRITTPGDYILKAKIYFRSADTDGGGGSVNCSFQGKMHGLFAGVGNYAHFGDGGMAISQGKDNFLLFDKNGLQVGPKTKIPGVLAAGRVNFRGVVQNSWGALVNRRNETIPNASKSSTGVYIVYHSIPHGNYIPTVTCMDEDGVSVYIRSSEIRPYQFTVRIFGTSSQRPYDAGFTYQLVGAP